MKTRIHKEVIFISGFISAAGMVSGQTNIPAVPEKTFWMKVPDYIDNPTVLFGAMMLFVLGFVFYALARSVRILSVKIIGEIESPEASLVEPVKKELIWSRLMKRMTRSVPVAQEADVMLDHNYDGIRELDNQLPPWWKWGFVFTIVFAVVYLISYHITGTGKLSLQEYSEELNQAAMQKEERIKIAGNEVTDENVVAMAGIPELTEGKNIFIKNCSACHGDRGQGIVGPNLTDEFWLHGGGIKNVFRTITEGVPGKGMISWKAQLAPKQIQQVASFILTLKGTKPDGAKEAQGEPWIEDSKPDSTTTVMRDSAAVAPSKNL
jgi:cytochrome c oxidase cbb3-type subunit 3